MKNEQNLQAALKYADLGYKVFAITPGAKHPLIGSHGCKDATTDPEIIEAMWEANPDANIGLSTNGLLVVDVDGDDNEWPGNERANDLSVAPMALTPNGGRHYMFGTNGTRYGNTAGKLATKVDTRGNGGYIVVGPSIVDGRSYQWAPVYPLVPPDQLPSPPAWLMQDIEQADQPKTRKHTNDGNTRTIPEGQRNSTLTKMAGKLVRLGLNDDTIYVALHSENENHCRPPIPRAEVDRIGKSIISKGCEPLVQDFIYNDFESEWRATDITSPVPSKLTPDPGPMPAHLIRVPGLINMVQDYCLETAPCPNPVMAFCGALTLQAFLGGRKVRDAEDNRTNIMVLGLGLSGSGKDWPRKLNVKIMTNANLGLCLGNGFASGEGIQDAVQCQPNILFQTDEIDSMLQCVANSRESRWKTVMSTLLTLYTSSASIFYTRKRAGKEPPCPVHQPSLSLLGSAIPKNYYGALSEHLLTNGFLGRSIILESFGERIDQRARIIDPPQDIMDIVGWWAGLQISEGNLSDIAPEPIIVPTTEAAHAILVKSGTANTKKIVKAHKDDDNVAAAVLSRFGEQVRKLALIYAISERHDDPEIGEEAVTWAIDFYEYQIARMLFMVQSHVADTPFQAMCLKVVEKLRSAPAKTISHSVLLKRMKIKSADFTALVNTLQEQGTIATDVNSTLGRKSRAYRLRE